MCVIERYPPLQIDHQHCRKATITTLARRIFMISRWPTTGNLDRTSLLVVPPSGSPTCAPCDAKKPWDKLTGGLR
jgi:hypothetical protein